MKNRIPEHLMIIEWTEPLGGGRELEKVAMFNSTVVSETTVRDWLGRGVLDWVLKPSVVIMTKQQYQNLFDREPTSDEANFYEELRLEQQGGIT